MSIQLGDFRGKIRNLFCESLQETIQEKDIDKVIDFVTEMSEKENNCFEFISNIFIKRYNDEEYIGITVFIQPIGYITLHGQTFENTLNGWRDILLKQPYKMDYNQAGFFIHNKNKSFLETNNHRINIINENTNLENYWVF